MATKKEQKIVVFLSLQSSDKNLILNGIKIASIFRKELCLLYNFSKKEKKEIDNIKFRLHKYTEPIKNGIAGLNVSTLLISHALSDLPEILSDEQEAIILIAPATQFSTYSKAVSESQIPFLFVHPDNNKIPEYKNLILPVDLRKEISDTALWSSYFGRYNHSRIVVIAANHRNKDFQKDISKNLFLTKKLFSKFNIVNKVLKGTKSSLQIVFEALDFAKETKADLLVILASSTITPIDYIIGLPERKIIKSAGNIPVLVLNPRKDNYILCD